MRLTRAEQAAIELLGRRRKSHTKYGQGREISTRLFNQLQRKGLLMEIGTSGYIMLTYSGEKVWTQLHPNSKYRIN